MVAAVSNPKARKEPPVFDWEDLGGLVRRVTLEAVALHLVMLAEHQERQHGDWPDDPVTDWRHS